MTFDKWFYSAEHRTKYTRDHPVYLAAKETYLWQKKEQAARSESAEVVAYMIHWDDGAVDLTEAPLPEFGESPLCVIPLYTTPPTTGAGGVPETVKDRLESWSKALTGWPENTAVGKVKSQMDKMLSTTPGNGELVRCKYCNGRGGTGEDWCVMCNATGLKRPQPPVQGGDENE